jgi:predicted GIY-YIG superfamily endonuclease
MCKLNNIKDKVFTLYHIQDENYIGITTNLHKRLLKHKSKSNFNINNTIVLHTFTNLDTALSFELAYQKLFKCSKGVRNQDGKKNPSAKEVLCLKHGVFYDTIKEACESLNYNYSSVRREIKNVNNKFLLIKV